MTAKKSQRSRRRKQEPADTNLAIKRLEEELRQAVAIRDRLVLIGTQLSSTLKLPDLVLMIVDAAKELLKAEKFAKSFHRGIWGDEFPDPNASEDPPDYDRGPSIYQYQRRR